MDRSTKLYTKAITYYNEGYIDKALDYCEKSISDNIKNASAINLKGLLYYIKGELESAQALWKMNYQVNRNAVAKKYLDDSRYDEDKRLFYHGAISLIKELKIREALAMLNKCEQSDFNSINVNNYIALCYIKLGEYSAALAHINKVLKIDRKNKNALDTRKELADLGVVKSSFKLRYIFAGVSVIVLALGIIISFKFINKDNKLVDRDSIKQDQLLLAPNDVTENNSNNQAKEANIEISKQQEEEKSHESFPELEASIDLSSKDYEKLYDVYIKWRNKELTDNQKYLMAQINELLTDSGVEYFYNAARQAMSSKNYKTALEYLEKGSRFGEEHYLNSHIIYLLGVSNKNLNDVETAIKYYKKYDNNYPNGDYEESVLYELALIYKNIDINEAKSYATKLSELYPKSMYNNSIVRDLMKR
ncbi:tetratricopeptide repeat protein [Clostridium swellfunianum]|uniref:tetratricopeptide repeat protein n=1 Tax=Clostridium swellfunianum TaxID=1367462 RepID=UPI00202FB897|nr:tetratricopeptide repeat protein [Clostridium swellfunianum]MCM0649452.1 tetratricopeptide repeat protein [Clostridium swellfunianum]